MLDRLNLIEERYILIENQMADPQIAVNFEKLQVLAQERSSLQPIIKIYRESKQNLKHQSEAKSLIKENDDEDIIYLAKVELEQLQSRAYVLQEELQVLLLPKDPNDTKDVIVEIRAGTGGSEAGLFAANLYRAYTRYADRVGWKTEQIDISETGIGSIKSVVFGIHGERVYSRLKHESGVHRIQRIPVTESGGRIHTSTATVAVLPEAAELDFQVKQEDLRIDIYHAGGHGGQNVQKVATAVRITHLPTGLVAICQDERSQLRNKQKAMDVLRSRLYDIEVRRQHDEISDNRRSQVGTGERSEKVRTYNFPQNRVTDHRIGLSKYNIEAVLDGDLDDFIDALISDEQSKKLKEVNA